jgi:hypothetical protein
LEVVVALELTMFAPVVGYDVGIVGCGFLDISWNLDYALSLQRPIKEGKLLEHMKESPAHSGEVVIGRPEANRSLFHQFAVFSPLMFCDKFRYALHKVKAKPTRDCQSLDNKEKEENKKSRRRKKPAAHVHLL